MEPLGGAAAAAGDGDAALLRTECDALRRERDRLQAALFRALRSVVIFRGYLHQQLTEDEALALLKPEWELKYFALGSGGLLKIYDSDRDEGGEPGALLNLADCVVEVEPGGVDRDWCMRVTERTPADAAADARPRSAPSPAPSAFARAASPQLRRAASCEPDGAVNELLLVSADSVAALLQWADAFERAGVRVVWPTAVGGRSGSSLSSRSNSAPLLQNMALAAAITAAAAPARGGPARVLERARERELESQGRGLLRTLSSTFALPPLMSSSAAPWCGAGGGGGASSGGAAAAAAAGGRPITRLPSERWVREPAREEFVPVLWAVQQQQEDEESAGRRGGPRRSFGARGLGRSASESRIQWGSSSGGAGAAEPARRSPSPAARRTALPGALPPQAPKPPRSPDRGVAAGRAPSGAAAAAPAPTAAHAPEAAAAAAAAAASHPHRRSRVMWGSTPVHTGTSDSLLTAKSTYTQSHSGLVTLALVVLATSHVRRAWGPKDRAPAEPRPLHLALMENLLTYRLRLTLLNREVARALLTMAGDNRLCILAVPGLLAFAAASLAIECAALALLRREDWLDTAEAKRGVGAEARRARRARRAASHEAAIVPLAVANCVAVLLLPCYTVFHLRAHPFPALLLTLGALVMQMKLMSYHHHHLHLRSVRRAHGPDARAYGERGGADEPAWAVRAYPENLTAGDMLFFLAVPTLVYQVNYPRLPRVRRRLLLRWFVMLFSLASVELLLIDQLLVPNMLSGLKPEGFFHFCERLLALALPNLYVWLLGFFLIFHVWLNILGELTRFADREFYRAWWNASSLDQFWRLWNMPVHRFLMRTIYFPMIRAGINKWWGLVFVFLWSALLHEVAVGVPFRILKGWGFWAMAGQIPLISLTAWMRAYLKNDYLGNAIFWTSFCILGQPLCILLYAHEYLRREYSGGMPVLSSRTC
ncbi:diacylglycerol O-acyltransferase-like protein [Raphidocelis subcapitata]|uniref:diacylglycerol O-acyltransferase n=1 Tax=Raphidocelis subcapitata TaxID=307507 RepID=A0A2V0NJJ6_9CHLO|nr:diacylglycerol O-acyltransferase-like protein [Raphidocelis subcapitata]|eukprot:GBF87398.1 diacylglycerol O-acyltransferase-like protein [Raphidocelis subcapitata]